MIKIKRVEAPLSGDALVGIGKTYPVVYFFSAWPGIDEAIATELGESEPGEVAIVAMFDPAGDVCKKFRLRSPQSMIAFSVNCFYGSADDPTGYASAIEGARKWRHQNKKSESTFWLDAPWTKVD